MTLTSENFRIDADSGLALGAHWLPSPHCDRRPPQMAIELLVIHAISLPPGKYGGDDVTALFLGTLDCSLRPEYAELSGLRVSTHFFIRRDGQVVQFVPLSQRAWHAGASRFGQRQRCNDFSVGIELEGSDQDPFMPAQYATLVALTRALRTACPQLHAEHIVGHSEIAPGRKSDPGPYFDWARYRGTLATP